MSRGTESNTTGHRTLTGKRIVVTGGTGLVGSHLVAELLRQDCRVRLLVREGSRFDRLDATLQRMGTAVEAGRLERYEAALNNPLELADALRGADVVFHCAARVSFDPQEEGDIVAANTEIATQVADACLECGVGLLVYVSSIAALGGPAPGTELVTEACELTTLEGRSPYSISKFYAESAVRRIALRGLRTVIVNPAIILGETDWNSGSGLLVKALTSWGVVGYPPGVKGYVDVRDVARAMVLLATSDEAVGRRFILSGGNLSFKEILTTVAAVAGRRPPFIPVSRGVLTFAARCGEQLNRLGRLGPRFTDALVASAADKTYYDGTLVCRVTGLQYTPLDETLRRVVMQYLTDKKRKA